ncbi:DUF3017 domain-containing protein [Kineococcus xinjiangensis]|uniref:DUF3017 domain-containing protein n=1 Tax=Kineococcus xinjiangensis TaxID=512762 RepID=UPI001304C3B9|nr:DUF3017 domain-containing protein [Kineococcus xinjiangensis]
MPPREVLLHAVLVGVVLALVVVVVAGPRAGGLVLAADLLLAGVLRLVLPVRVVGALAVRSRAFDVVVALALALACAGLAWVVPTGG